MFKDAQAALTRFNSFEKFTISSKPVTACYVHAGVFVPVFKFVQDERFVFSPLSNRATKLAYWDEDAYVSELVVTEAPEERSSAISEAQVKTATDKAAAAAVKEGLVAPGKETEAKAKKRKAEAKDSSKLKKVRVLKMSRFDAEFINRLLQLISNSGAIAMRNSMV